MPTVNRLPRALRAAAACVAALLVTAGCFETADYTSSGGGPGPIGGSVDSAVGGEVAQRTPAQRTPAQRTPAQRTPAQRDGTQRDGAQRDGATSGGAGDSPVAGSAQQEAGRPPAASIGPASTGPASAGAESVAVDPTAVEAPAGDPAGVAAAATASSAASPQPSPAPQADRQAAQQEAPQAAQPTTLADAFADILGPPAPVAEGATDRPAPAATGPEGSTGPRGRAVVDPPASPFETPTGPGVVQPIGRAAGDPPIADRLPEADAPPQVATLPPMESRPARGAAAAAPGEGSGGAAPVTLPPVDPPAGFPTSAENTRRIAWLLGRRLSDVAVASLGGADPPLAWQAPALAEMLGVPPPAANAALPGKGATTPAATVSALIREARRVARGVSERHGDDHAALLELAVKSTILPVVAGGRPPLAESVAAALVKASARAGLPSGLCQPLRGGLSADASPEALRRGVDRLHREVEATLADGAP